MPLGAAADREARSVFLDWRDRLAAGGKLREAENRLAILARVLAWAFDRNVLQGNPLATWERAYKADRSDQIWLPEHVTAFAEHASPTMLLALSLALFSGQRQGDLLAAIAVGHFICGKGRADAASTCHA
jgi:hypothetical protein